MIVDRSFSCRFEDLEDPDHYTAATCEDLVLKYNKLFFNLVKEFLGPMYVILIISEHFSDYIFLGNGISFFISVGFKFGMITRSPNK